MESVAVSIIIPLYNAQKTIAKTIDSIFAQEYSGLIELIVIDDGSTDDSLVIVKKIQSEKKFKIIIQNHQGAVVAINEGIKESSNDIVCNIDADVVLSKDWLSKIVEEFSNPKVSAVQGYFKAANNINFLARIAGYDLEKRYDDIKEKYVSHISTGNTAYRKSALNTVGLFDPKFEYAYDNDMSYRLTNFGYLLALRKDAICEHYWKTSINSYIRQQYWSGYGRMQVIEKHKNKFMGDSISGIRMILQVPVTILAILLIICGGIINFFISNNLFLWVGLLLLSVILIDRIIFASELVNKRKDFCIIFLPIVHLLRNIVWSVAFFKWSFDRIINKE